MTRQTQKATLSRRPGVGRSTLVGILLMTLVGASAGVALAKKKPAIKDEAKQSSEFSEERILAPDLIDVMHELFRHYVTAGVAFGNKNYTMAVAHLDVTLYNIELMYSLVPDTDKDGKPISEQDFIAKADVLKKNVQTLRDHIAKKRYKKATAMAPDAVTGMCIFCHQSVKVPPPWPEAD